MPTAALDRQRLLEALALAETSFGLTDPNPRVGCVIGTEDGQVLGRGATQQAGGPHAEVMALRDAQAAGHDVRGATAWVSLEPCAHHGRTPPCCDALIAAGIARVVAAAVDPFAPVNGHGLARLRAAGVRADVAGSAAADAADLAHLADLADVAEAAREINIGFFSRIERGRPWLRLKTAASLDGRTALPNGRSQWITGPEARRDGHAWRRRAGAVLTGIGTVLADDPRLDVRLVRSVLQPLRVVLDSQLRLPPTARLLQPPGRVLVVTAVDAPERAAALAAAGAEVLLLPNTDADADADAGARANRQVDLPALLAHLAQRGMNEVHAEAGAVLNAALLRASLVDELLLYLAPLLVGAGHGIAALGPWDALADAPRWRFIDVQPLGADIRLRARPAPPPGQSAARSA